MTGTSRALKRLGVAGLGATLASVGMMIPATVAGASTGHATTATSVSLDKHDDTAVDQICNPFTATIAPNGGSMTVQLTQTITAADTTHNFGFCVPNSAIGTTDTGPSNFMVSPGGAGSPGANSTVVGGACTANAASPPGPPTVTTGPASCEADYTDTSGDGKITFGVTSTDPGDMQITAFGDLNGNGALDAAPTDGGRDTAVKHWLANNTKGTAANGNKISCTPGTAQNPAGTRHSFTCTLTDAGGHPIPNAKNINFIVTSGPGSAAPGQGISYTTDSDGNNAASTNPDNSADVSGSKATCAGGGVGNGTGNGSNTSVPGQVTCSYLNNGQPGHDVIYVYEETNNTPAAQPEEPNTTITKDWVLAAPSGSLVTISCDKNQTATGTTNNTANTGTTCQDPTTDNTVGFTATVKSGSPATGVQGVLIQFSVGTVSGQPDATATQTLSPTQCTTTASGSCGTTMTESNPADGEQVQVIATVQRQAAPPATTVITASATKLFHNPQRHEARNITVVPDGAQQTSGGSQTWLATVTDRFGNPVPNVCVGWNDTGAGTFPTPNLSAGTCLYSLVNANNYQAACQTGPTGTCQQQTVTGPSESGPETVTANIDVTPGSPGDNSNAGPGNGNVECTEPAGQTFGNNNTAPQQPATGSAAPAGNCSESGSVNWVIQQPGGGGRQVVTMHLTCFSNHPHNVTCRAQLNKPIAGVTVVLHDTRGNVVGRDTTNGSGKAHFHIHHLKRHKVHHYRAHAKKSAATKSADSNTSRVRVQ